MSREPPHVNTDPCPQWERHYHSPCQDPLPGPETTKPFIEWGRPTTQEHLHLWSCWRRALPENTRLGLMGFSMAMFFALQVLCHRWGRSLLMLLFVVLLLLAPYYAQNFRIQHRFARFVRKLFFISFTYPGDTHVPRLLLRTAPMMIIPTTSVILLFWP